MLGSARCACAVVLRRVRGRQIKVYDDDFDCSCLSACAVPTNRYDDADGWRDKHTMDNRSMGLAKKDEFSHMGQIS